MANAVGLPAPVKMISITLFDIIDAESVPALQAMIDNSPGHSYVYPDLTDVNMLKVSILNAADDSVITRMEIPTNVYGAPYAKAMYGEPGAVDSTAHTVPSVLATHDAQNTTTNMETLPTKKQA